MSTQPIDYILVDAETGGRDPNLHSLLSLYMALVHFKDGVPCLKLSDLDKRETDKQLDLFEETYGGFVNSNAMSLLVKPNSGNYVVEAEGLAVNKIDLIEHDRRAVTYDRAGDCLVDYLLSIRKQSFYDSTKIHRLVFMGWNPEYDVRAITEHLLSSNQRAKDVFNATMSYSSFDVKSIAMANKERGLLPDDLHLSLGNVARFFNLNTENAHNAQADCMLTLEVLKCLLEDQKQNKKV